MRRPHRVVALAHESLCTFELAAAALVITALTVLVTWPQARDLSTRIAAHDDAMFSIWRLAWIAHALGSDPGHIFDGNIFHPVSGTLTFSDATFLEGVIAAPLFWAGVSAVVVYNLLLLAGIVASGLAMFVLARHLTGAWGPALIAAAIFTVAPYRIEHFMHLELQWAMWIPLTLWAIHRTVEGGGWRYGALAGLFLWLQVLSSVYYGLFLAVACLVLVPLLLAASPKQTWRALPAVAFGGFGALTLTLPYALLYLGTARTMTRSATEVAAYSATPWNYLASPAQSALWWWTGDRFGGMGEHSLFPGAVAIAIALAAAAYRPRRIVAVYAVLTFVLFELSLGLNGHLYSWLFQSFHALHGIRAPSRIGLFVCATVALLAGFGSRALQRRAANISNAAAALLVAGLTMLVATDSATRGMYLTEPPYPMPTAFNVYDVIRANGPGPILELPLPRLEALPGHDATYMLWSTTHWYPLVNGNSGYYPVEYGETISRMEAFPDDRSIAHLTNLRVRYVVVHRAFYDAAKQYDSLIEALAARPELRPLGKYADPLGECRLFMLVR